MGKKISDEELVEEIRRGKTESEIAEDNGYSVPSGRLNQRIRSLGFQRNQKLTLHENNAAVPYISASHVEEMADKKDIDLESTETLFFNFSVDKQGNGEIVLTTDSFKQVD